ncbi:site-specific integrase [Calothrix sp. CCY 0018]|uniref:site-specific integrase n=1 Tax=Calothrix sp. CCY 0018 TaxID=3103864 RepID=UPI0039C672E1
MSAEELNAINKRLAEGLMGVRVEQLGSKLYLRATLPPKPNSDKSRPSQQRIALGIKANSRGVKRAEAEAYKLAGLLACKDFEWEIYLQGSPESPLVRYIKDLIVDFENFYFETRQRNHKTVTTWTVEYLRVFLKLPQDELLTKEAILKVVTATRPDTRTRKRVCMGLQSLADFAGIKINLKPYKGKYSPKKATPRDLPDDATIAKYFFEIENESWRWVYGMLATYGLRNHEVFRLDFNAIEKGDYIVNVGENSKTGSRRVWPCYPEWFEQFDLQNVKLPSVNVDRANADVGHVVTVWFKRHIPFAPYNLRHCWAVRTLEFGLDISLAAQQMGHSNQVHSELYHHWISERHHQRAFELMMMRESRPQPPVVLGHKPVKFFLD